MHWEDVYHVIHTCRYKIDYHLIELRRKYYSNSRNPRVIHTKLQDRMLFSLRTCPHDKYLPKADEFLTLEKATDTESLMDIYLEEEEPLVNLDETSSFDDHRPMDVFSPTTPQTPQTSPIYPHENRPQTAQRSQTSQLPKSEKLRNSLPDIQKVWARLPFTASRMQNLMSKNVVASSTNESVEAFHTSYKCPQCVNENKMVWKTVLNDVSLSAARLSTGSDGVSRDDYENLSGDFIDSKRKEDLFVENLAEGRAKFHGKVCVDWVFEVSLKWAWSEFEASLV